jgi:hypothetical protein
MWLLQDGVFDFGVVLTEMQGPVVRVVTPQGFFNEEPPVCVFPLLFHGHQALNNNKPSRKWAQLPLVLRAGRLDRTAWLGKMDELRYSGKKDANTTVARLLWTLDNVGCETRKFQAMMPLVDLQTYLQDARVVVAMLALRVLTVANPVYSLVSVADLVEKIRHTRCHVCDRLLCLLYTYLANYDVVAAKRTKRRYDRQIKDVRLSFLTFTHHEFAALVEREVERWL